MSTSWKRCEGSINSGHGALWMRNASVWFAARLSRASRSRLSEVCGEQDRCALFARPSIAIQYQWIGFCRLTKFWQILRFGRHSAALRASRFDRDSAKTQSHRKLRMLAVRFKRSTQNNLGEVPRKRALIFLRARRCRPHRILTDHTIIRRADCVLRQTGQAIFAPHERSAHT